MNFDPLVETRLLLNGRLDLTPEELTRSTLANKLEGTQPPSKVLVDYLAAGLSEEELDTDRATERLDTVMSCRRRYDRGIPINWRMLEDKRRYVAVGKFPDGIIDAQGKINAEVLEKSLSASDRDRWPRRQDGTLRTDSGTLVGLDCSAARELLHLQDTRVGSSLMGLAVDDDGRHRSWPNPFGTVTGREKPLGHSFAYLPKRHRDLIGPDIVEIDYCQQEPTIAAVFAGDDRLLVGDVYEAFSQEYCPELSRKEAKYVVIACLYGASARTLMKELGVTWVYAEKLHRAAHRLLGSVMLWQDQYHVAAYRHRRVESLDWSMIVTPDTPIRTLKNWPIQAAGADILRRACRRLDKAEIPVVGCLHDAVLIEVEDSRQVALAQGLMQRASADVLSGIELDTTVKWLGVSND